MEQLSSRRYVSPYHLALVNAALGRIEASLDLLENAYRQRRRESLVGRRRSELEPLHGHPRFNDLLRKLDHRLVALPPISAHIGSDQESIAVLPFRVLSPPGENTGDEYLGVGLTDALITRLSNVQRLVVRPTSSVLRYQGAAIDPLVAGRDLGIDYIVDGSIRRVGNRIRVTAQLLNVNEGVTRWAEHFDEDSTDVLQIEDSISEKVASALLPQLTRDEQRQLSKRGTDSSEAFEAYLRGRYYWNFYTEVGSRQSLSELSESYRTRSGLRARLHRHRRLLQLARRIRREAVRGMFGGREAGGGESRRTGFRIRRSLQRTRFRHRLSRLRLGRRRRTTSSRDRDQSELRDGP